MSRAFDMGFTRWDNAFDPFRATPADGADRDAILASLLGEPFDMDCRCRYGIVLYFSKQRRYLEQMPVVRATKARQIGVFGAFYSSSRRCAFVRNRDLEPTPAGGHSSPTGV